MKYTVSLPEITKVIMTNAPQELPGDEKESRFSFLRDHDLFYSVYPKKKRPRYKKIYNRILPMKYEIPS